MDSPCRLTNPGLCAKELIICHPRCIRGRMQMFSLNVALPSVPGRCVAAVQSHGNQWEGPWRGKAGFAAWEEHNRI